jgi:hypothetical protein
MDMDMECIRWMGLKWLFCLIGYVTFDWYVV